MTITNYLLLCFGVLGIVQLSLGERLLAYLQLIAYIQLDLEAPITKKVFTIAIIAEQNSTTFFKNSSNFALTSSSIAVIISAFSFSEMSENPSRELILLAFSVSKTSVKLPEHDDGRSESEALSRSWQKFSYPCLR